MPQIEANEYLLPLLQSSLKLSVLRNSVTLEVLSVKRGSFPGPQGKHFTGPGSEDCGVAGFLWVEIGGCPCVPAPSVLQGRSPALSSARPNQSPTSRVSASYSNSVLWSLHGLLQAQLAASLMWLHMLLGGRETLCFLGPYYFGLGQDKSTFPAFKGWCWARLPANPLFPWARLTGLWGHGFGC